MPLKFYQKKNTLKALQEKTSKQILGEILHFVIERLLSEKKFNPSLEEIKLLIKKALATYPEPLSERLFLEEKAYEILNKALRAEAWKVLEKLLADAKEIYAEIEGFSQKESQLLRPDLFVFKDKTLLLMEIKLHKEDLKEEQIDLYLSFLSRLYPHLDIEAYFLFLEPFEFTLFRKIKRGSYESKSPFHSPQLSLFEKLS